MQDHGIDLTVAEYFAGIGLVRMGLEREDWRVVYANDISAKKYAMYQAFYPDSASHYEIADIYNVDPIAIPRTTLATCSFPCIDLSLAGNMTGIIDGKHSSAFWGFIKVLKTQGDATPPMVMVENVPGWLLSNKGMDFRVTVEALNQLGYACNVFTLDAMRFTPQSRMRVFLIGVRGAINGGIPTLLLQRPASLLSENLRKSVQNNLDLCWFNLNIPNPPPLHRDGLSTIIEQISNADRRWWSNEEVNRHINMMNDAHKARVLQLKQGDSYIYRAFYRRRRIDAQRAEVRDDDLSGCLRTAVGGSGKQFLIRAGKGEIQMRAMTPREYARLQGVPDHYRITVDSIQALTGFGDAVCVPAIQWIAKHVLTPLAQSSQLTAISV
jgi:DNA (cytosine-5)-methyltransferase 1